MKHKTRDKLHEIENFIEKCVYNFDKQSIYDFQQFLPCIVKGLDYQFLKIKENEQYIIDGGILIASNYGTLEKITQSDLETFHTLRNKDFIFFERLDTDHQFFKTINDLMLSGI